MNIIDKINKYLQKTNQLGKIIYLITFDISNNEERNKLNTKIENYDNAFLSNTTYLIYCNNKEIHNLYKDIQLEYETDNLSIIDIKNKKQVNKKCINLDVENFLSNFL